MKDAPLEISGGAFSLEDAMKEAIVLVMVALLVLPMLGAVRRLRRLPRKQGRDRS